MKKAFSPQERDAFAKAVSAVEGIRFSQEDDQFFAGLHQRDEPIAEIMKRVIDRALEKCE